MAGVGEHEALGGELRVVLVDVRVLLPDDGDVRGVLAVVEVEVERLVLVVGVSCHVLKRGYLRLTAGVLVRGHLGFERFLEGDGSLVDVDLGERFELRLKVKG